jgi:hypothetical protein
MNFFQEKQKVLGQIPKSGNSREQIFLTEVPSHFRICPHEKILFGREYAEKTQNTAAGRPSSELALVAGTRFCTDPSKSFINAYPGVYREFGLDHARKVNIMVAAELARILPE